MPHMAMAMATMDDVAPADIGMASAATASMAMASSGGHGGHNRGKVDRQHCVVHLYFLQQARKA